MTDAALHLFLATDLEEVERETHGPEEAHSDVLHVDLADAVDMILCVEIHDAKTVIGLLMVDRRLRA
jgi:ADP-ribose pyrophosphatase